MVFKLATVNVNGIRAAVKKGMKSWLELHQPDIVCVQEVRAPDSVVRQLFANDWQVFHEECADKGRAGVAILSKLQPVSQIVPPPLELGQTGRWVEATFRLPGGHRLTVISTYVYTGSEHDEKRLRQKLDFVEAAIARFAALQSTSDHVALAGDLNIARSNNDIKNWKGNIGKAGFLDVERDTLEQLFTEHEAIDLGRHLAGDSPGPYTWWSYRGQAFDNDSGWRIDYLIANQALASMARAAEVHRAESYSLRWSDHAPLVTTFDIDHDGLEGTY